MEMAENDAQESSIECGYGNSSDLNDSSDDGGNVDENRHINDLMAAYESKLGLTEPYMYVPYGTFQLEMDFPLLNRITCSQCLGLHLFQSNNTEEYFCSPKCIIENRAHVNVRSSFVPMSMVTTHNGRKVKIVMQGSTVLAVNNMDDGGGNNNDNDQQQQLLHGNVMERPFEVSCARSITQLKSQLAHIQEIVEIQKDIIQRQAEIIESKDRLLLNAKQKLSGLHEMVGTRKARPNGCCGVQ